MTSVRAMHLSKLRDRPDNDHDCDTSDIDSEGRLDASMAARISHIGCWAGRCVLRVSSATSDGKERRVREGQRGHSANAGHRSRKKGATPHGGRGDSLHGM